jgi:hypothetical protein
VIFSAVWCIIWGMGQKTVLAAAMSAVWWRGSVRLPEGGYRSCWYNDALRDASDTDRYPYRLRVEHDAQTRADRVEAKLIAAVAGRAVYAGGFTQDGIHQFVFYTDSQDWTGDLDDDELTVTCGPDPDWSTYRGLEAVGRSDGTGFYAALASCLLLSFAPAILTGVERGLAWGIGDLAVFVVLLIVVAFNRMSWLGPQRHPALTLVFCAALAAAVLFPVIGLFRHWWLADLSTTAGASIAVAVGSRNVIRNRQKRSAAS